MRRASSGDLGPRGSAAEGDGRAAAAHERHRVAPALRRARRLDHDVGARAVARHRAEVGRERAPLRAVRRRAPVARRRPACTRRASARSARRRAPRPSAPRAPPRARRRAGSTRAARQRCDLGGERARDRVEVRPARSAPGRRAALRRRRSGAAAGSRTAPPRRARTARTRRTAQSSLRRRAGRSRPRCRRTRARTSDGGFESSSGCPRRNAFRSVPSVSATSTWTRTSPGPGRGSGTSSTRRSPGPWKRAALTGRTRPSAPRGAGRGRGPRRSVERQHRRLGHVELGQQRGAARIASGVAEREPTTVSSRR